jgi:hypothetical protein
MPKLDSSHATEITILALGSAELILIGEYKLVVGHTSGRARTPSTPLIHHTVNHLNVIDLIEIDTSTGPCAIRAWDVTPLWMRP